MTSITSTLTQGEIAATFRMAPPDHDQLPARRRSPLLWDGATWAEIDPETGDVIATGTVGHADREELRS